LKSPVNVEGRLTKLLNLSHRALSHKYMSRTVLVGYFFAEKAFVIRDLLV
jgi:hypothetical protein